MKYFLQIYGCQMNHSDAQRLSTVLEQMGYERSDDENEADLAVFVACAVRESAVNRLYGNGKKFKRIRRQRPHFKAILTGCVVKKDRPKLEKLFDVIIDIRHIGELPVRLGLANEKESEDDYFRIKPKREQPFTAYVPIMTGCNNYCSYCIVPYTRGPEYSRPAADILAEVDALVKGGCREIILLGQNVNSYRPADGTGFPALLERISALEGDFWIRFLTSHPKDMSEQLIRTVAASPKCTNFIHLAMQSGNDEILQRMNRKYTSAHFLDLAGMIRARIPDVMLTTDIIVGFPGETEAQFQDTAALMRAARFDIAYINKYSPRSGTASAALPDDVSFAEKKRREKALNAVLRETAQFNNEKYLGREVEVLIESADRGYYFGKTRSFKDIKLAADSVIPVGSLTKAKVTKVTPWALEGIIV